MQPLSEYDVVIIGSGIAGLYTALKLDASKKVLVLSKDDIKNSNTNLAQGGIAVTFDANDFDSHVQDTLKTGFFHNDEQHLKEMVEDGAHSIHTLINWGVQFDADHEGNLMLTKEGGHSSRRIIHYKDTTGREIVRALYDAVIQKENIVLRGNLFATDLIVRENQVYGIQFIENNEQNVVFASSVVLATGGIGELYKHTTNSEVSTADGIAMAYKVGATVKDMEFVQFHPTALNIKGHAHFLISEAVRGEGGILRNASGSAFMAKYHALKDLAPRSVVAKSIFEEIDKQSSDKIYLDVTHLPENFVKERFPNIYSECLSKGIDIIKEWIPIIPVQHYMMGGIATDKKGRTNIVGLYACGEVACTGVHGANRMASNSLLEGAVFAHRVAEDINDSTRKIMTCPVIRSTVQKRDLNHLKMLRHQLQDIMNDDVFIFRTKKQLLKAKNLIETLTLEIKEDELFQEAVEVKNMLIVASLIVKAALKREKSLGSHIIEGDH